LSPLPVTFATVREIGLEFPRAREIRYYRMPALAVDGEVFAVQTGHRSAEPNSISIPVGFERRDELIAADPHVFYLKQHYAPYPVVLVRLGQITRGNLQRLLRSAYDAVSSGNVSVGRRRAGRRKKSAKAIIRRKRSR
jgi:hypothetical protein